MRRITTLFMAFLLVFSGAALAEGIGKIKKVSGDVRIERDGQSMPARVGASVQEQDVIITGEDGSIGLLFADDSRMSAGPRSKLVLEDFSFNPATGDGTSTTSLLQGMLSAVAGKMTRKKPESMKVKTPSAVLAVRGTEFSVKVDPTPAQGSAP